MFQSPSQKPFRHSGRTRVAGEIRNLLQGLQTTADSGFIADEAGDAAE
jgi:hypothetical protein